MSLELDDYINNFVFYHNDLFDRLITDKFLNLIVTQGSLLEFVLSCTERQIPNVKSLGQLRSPLRLSRCDHPTLYAEGSDRPVCRPAPSDTDNRPGRKGFSNLAGRTRKEAATYNDKRLGETIMQVELIEGRYQLSPGQVARCSEDDDGARIQRPCS